MSAVDRSMTIAMVAGESSGDNLGASLMHQLKLKVPNINFVGVGGASMLREGFDSLVEMDRLSVNGFVDPILRLPELISILFRVRDRILESNPDCFIGIDSNFFNILLAGMLRPRGVKTVQYVSPTLWAWRSGRVKRIKRNVDLMLTLFPFEEAIYREHNIPVAFVGHPKAMEIGPDEGLSNKAAARAALSLPDDANVVALLPGSRSSEVAKSGPDFLAAARLLKQKVDIFLVPAASPHRRSQIMQLLGDYADLEQSVRVLSGDSKTAISAADLVLVNSGTATLEAMLLKRPMVMSYRIGSLGYLIVSRLVRVNLFALPNILAQKKLIPEFIQDEANPENLAKALVNLMEKANNNELLRAFDDLHHELRKDEGTAAIEVLKLCSSNVPG